MVLIVVARCSTTKGNAKTANAGREKRYPVTLGSSRHLSLDHLHDQLRRDAILHVASEPILRVAG